MLLPFKKRPQLFEITVGASRLLADCPLGSVPCYLFGCNTWTLFQPPVLAHLDIEQPANTT